MTLPCPNNVVFVVEIAAMEGSFRVPLHIMHVLPYGVNKLVIPVLGPVQWVALSPEASCSEDVLLTWHSNSKLSRGDVGGPGRPPQPHAACRTLRHEGFRWTPQGDEHFFEVVVQGLSRQNQGRPPKNLALPTCPWFTTLLLWICCLAF